MEKGPLSAWRLGLNGKHADVQMNPCRVRIERKRTKETAKESDSEGKEGRAVDSPTNLKET